VKAERVFSERCNSIRFIRFQERSASFTAALGPRPKPRRRRLSASSYKDAILYVLFYYRSAMRASPPGLNP